MTDQDLEQEIERTREHLGNTIDELAGKADMKARARTRAAEVKARAGPGRRRVRPGPPEQGSTEPSAAAPLASRGGGRRPHRRIGDHPAAAAR